MRWDRRILLRILETSNLSIIGLFFNISILTHLLPDARKDVEILKLLINSTFFQNFFIHIQYNILI